jgi:hypothetical protein
MDRQKSTAESGCWKKLWAKAVNDYWGFPDQQDEIRGSLW